MAVSRKVRRAWMIGGGLVTAVVLVMGVTQVVVGMAHEEYTVEETYDAADISAIEVDTAAGSVRVIGTDAATDTITVTARVSDGLKRTRHRQEVEGDRLVLDTRCPGFFSNFCEVSYTVETPSDLDVAVQARGSVDVSGIDGDVEVQTRNRIEATRLGGDETTLRSRDGAVEATDLVSPHVDLSSHGRIYGTFVETPEVVRAQAGYSSVELVVPDEDDAVFNLETHSSFGTESTSSVRHDPDSDRTIVARAEGDVTIRYGS